jgi:hypothetical protein
MKKTIQTFFGVGALLGLTLLSGCLVDKGELVDETPAEYCDTLQATYIDTCKTIVDTYCALPGCHNNASTIGDFSTYAGMSAQGVLVDGSQGLGGRITSTTSPMPPTGLLPDSTRRVLECWASDGYPQQ